MPAWRPGSARRRPSADHAPPVRGALVLRSRVVRSVLADRRRAARAPAPAIAGRVRRRSRTRRGRRRPVRFGTRAPHRRLRRRRRSALRSRRSTAGGLGDRDAHSVGRQRRRRQHGGQRQVDPSAIRTSSAPHTAPTSIDTTAVLRRIVPGTGAAEDLGVRGQAGQGHGQHGRVQVGDCHLARRWRCETRAQRPAARSPRSPRSGPARTLAAAAITVAPAIEQRLAATSARVRPRPVVGRSPGAEPRLRSPAPSRKAPERHQRRHHRQPGGAADPEPQQHDVAGHVGGEHVTEAEIARRRPRCRC